MSASYVLLPWLMLVRRGATLSWLLFVAGGVWACTVPATSKSELKICKAGEDGCPAERPKSSTPKRDTTPGPGPGTETPIEAPSTADAGTDAGAFGPLCLKLKACCEAFVENGVFSDFCYEALETRKESICFTKHQSYVNDPENQFCEK